MKERYVVLVTTAPSLHAPTRELATRLARRANAVLLFLHVVPLQREDGEGMLHAALDARSGEAEAWLRAQHPSERGVRSRHRLEVGAPEEVVASFVATHEVELVVAEEPPRSWVSELLWRGLAERLVKRVACPVIIGGPGFLRSDPPEHAPVATPLPKATVAELLNAMVDARTEALCTWMDHMADAARRIAASEPLQHLSADLAGGAQVDRGVQVALEEHRRALGAEGWQITGATPDLVTLPVSDAGRTALEAFLDRVARDGASTSLPLSLADADDRLVVLAGAQLPGGGILTLVFDAADDVLRILGQPGPLPSFETYAFDGQGLMLSHSGFPDQLVASGLLPDDDTQAPGLLRVAEPSEGPVASWPLTRMAREALRKGDGWNTQGYRDYRGVPVVGAWRWVHRYGFGVAAEVDRQVAFP